MLLKETIRLLKTRDMIKEKIIKTKVIMISQCQIYMVFCHTNLGYCVTLVNKFETERTRVDVHASFYCSIYPLNFLDFKVNLIAVSNKLRFCWNLNLLLP